MEEDIGRNVMQLCGCIFMTIWIQCLANTYKRSTEMENLFPILLHEYVVYNMQYTTTPFKSFIYNHIARY